MRPDAPPSPSPAFPPPESTPATDGPSPPPARRRSLRLAGVPVPSPLSTQMRPDAPPSPSASFPPPESTPATDGSSPPPARRRSLRLAGVPIPSPSLLADGVRRRKRASISPAVEAIGGSGIAGKRAGALPYPPRWKRLGEAESRGNVQAVSITADPSSTATRTIEERANMLIAPRRVAPSLKKLCLEELCRNTEKITSIDGISNKLKHELVSLCDSSRMSPFTQGSPDKLLLNSCTWATEEVMEGVLAGCNTRNLKVIQLDLCGRSVTDYIWRGILTRSPESLPSLTTLSLRGAYRLSDDGLNAIAASAPLLSSLNLRECSLLTSDGINSLADKLGTVLRELNIDDCQNVDAMAILPALKKLKHLEVLSVAGIQTVSDKFIKELLSFSGSNIRELNVAGCCKLSDASMKVIGENCSQLSSLDLQDLTRHTDSAIGYVANGCRSIKKLKLRRNGFSDEAVAAFLEASGEALTELSLNKIVKVAHHTAVAISRRCSATLKVLDLSFCRIVSDESLGLIVDNCLKYLDAHRSQVTFGKAIPTLQSASLDWIDQYWNNSRDLIFYRELS